MNLYNISIIIVILATVLFYLIRDYMRGLCISVFLLAFLTPYLFIETPGSFPNFTIHRLILILLFIVWLVKGRTNKKIVRVPFLKLILFFLITNFISLMISVDFTSSLKQFLSYVFELFVFYLIILKSIEKRYDALRLLKYICFSLALVAFFALIEKYTGFNPVNQFVHGHIRPEGVGSVISTYPHRILLGTAMAMAFPIGLVLIDEAKENKFKRITAWCLTGLFLSSCYFAMSRGPWLAIILAGLIMFSLGSSSLRKKALIIVMLSMLALTVKPGVWETLEYQAAATMDEKTIKGANYQYRWELWKIAYTEIRKSPVRTIWGYGQGSSKAMNITANVSIQRYRTEILSWDNHYAWYLVATGFVGLTAAILLYGSIAKRMFMLRRKVVESDRDIMTSVISSIMVLLFMMSNVFIFAPQLNYLFWTLVAVGIILGQQNQKADLNIESKR